MASQKRKRMDTDQVNRVDSDTGMDDKKRIQVDKGKGASLVIAHICVRSGFYQNVRKPYILADLASIMNFLAEYKRTLASHRDWNQNADEPPTIDVAFKAYLGRHRELPHPKSFEFPNVGNSGMDVDEVSGSRGYDYDSDKGMGRDIPQRGFSPLRDSGRTQNHPDSRRAGIESHAGRSYRFSSSNSIGVGLGSASPSLPYRPSTPSVPGTPHYYHSIPRFPGMTSAGQFLADLGTPPPPPPPMTAPPSPPPLMITGSGINRRSSMATESGRSTGMTGIQSGASEFSFTGITPPLPSAPFQYGYSIPGIRFSI
ncbi:hypothetical protein NHQ30_000394 [Ciborinia camelliae]|nr:hypothetical protein NHQ30_000394 [Ciborinia camelliae]